MSDIVDLKNAKEVRNMSWKNKVGDGDRETGLSIGC